MAASIVVALIAIALVAQLISVSPGEGRRTFARGCYQPTLPLDFDNPPQGEYLGHLAIVQRMVMEAKLEAAAWEIHRASVAVQQQPAPVTSLLDMPEEPNAITGQHTPAIHMPWYQRVPKWLQQEVTS